jgi:hypothetical protein
MRTRPGPQQNRFTVWVLTNGIWYYPGGQATRVIAADQSSSPCLRVAGRSAKPARVAAREDVLTTFSARKFSEILGQVS